MEKRTVKLRAQTFALFFFLSAKHENLNAVRKKTRPPSGDLECRFSGFLFSLAAAAMAVPKSGLFQHYTDIMTYR